MTSAQTDNMQIESEVSAIEAQTDSTPLQATPDVTCFERESVPTTPVKLDEAVPPQPNADTVRNIDMD